METPLKMNLCNSLLNVSVQLGVCQRNDVDKEGKAKKERNHDRAMSKL